MSTIIDPVAQTFMIESGKFPNGAFISSINLFFSAKPSVVASNSTPPVRIYIVPTLNGYPIGTSLNYSSVSLTAEKVNVSATPHYLDSTSYTTFTFPAPVYINPDVLYAFVVESSSSEYTLWTAAQNSLALPSTAKALPTDANPTAPTKIGAIPLVGSLFESQNAITWTADINKALMFTINRCKFSTSSPTISFVVPRGLPNRKSIDTQHTQATANAVIDALNISTTEFVPTGTAITYQYTSTLNSTGTSDGPYSVIPGKFGTPLSDNIHLDDNSGSRVLNYLSNTSFKLDVTLNTLDDKVSPILSDDGLNLYTVRYRINNLELANNNLTIVDGGTGFLSGSSGILSSPDITVSAPDSTSGTQAYVSANVQSGNIVSVYVTTAGSGYATTPTVTITAANTTPATITAIGESSPTGGNAYSRYVTKPVTLSTGNDSGDLRVYLTAYRPVKTQIYVYYKIISRDDTQAIDAGDWVLMTPVNGDSKYSTVRGEVYEYEYAPGTGGVADNTIQYTSKTTGVTYTSFYQYMIKIVMASSDSTFTPYINDMRAIALPSGTGL